MHNLDFTHERDLTVDELVRRIEAYFPDANIELFRKACHFAEKAHTGQKRSSGEDYIIHPFNVTATLIKLRMDMDSLIAGLLHDTIEDCQITAEEIEKEFSPSISQIVVGLTKISKIKFQTKEESQAENFRKMIVAMAKDLRVIIVKLADRMHNMRTLKYISEEKQKKIAQETLDIYVPLASRLGINSVKGELEDLCLRFLRPDMYYKLAEKVAMKKSQRDAYINETIEIIKEKLLDYSVKGEVKGRPKHFYSIYKKMISRSVEFDQIQDILAFRILVNNITECYKALGIIHSSFTPMPGRFKDYIAIPKANNYQSLHTTVIGPKAERIEIQIRTSDMDQIAETGIAAHWKYKEVGSNTTPKLQWVEELLEFNKNVDSSREFLDAVKNDLDLGGVFIFTPKGDVHELSHGSTPLDFAYTVHTEVGNHCVGAKVNGKIVPLRYQLRSGDTLEILTSKTQSPSKDWLNIARTSRARTKIKQYLLKVERDHYREVGKDIFEKALRVYGISTNRFKKTNDLEKILAHFHYKVEDEIYIHLGAGKIQAKNIFEVLPDFKPEEETEDQKALDEIKATGNKIIEQAKKRKNRDQQIIVDGLDDIMVRLARCCTPIPGDPIEGHITRGRGITVHVKNCPRVHDSSTGGTRHVDVEWNNFLQHKHSVVVKVITHDRPGILSHISKTINNLGINIRSAMARSLPDRRGSFLFEVELKDLTELTKMILTIEALEEVISASRTTS